MIEPKEVLRIANSLDCTIVSPSCEIHVGRLIIMFDGDDVWIKTPEGRKRGPFRDAAEMRRMLGTLHRRWSFS